jgi:competence protein ComEC
VEFAGQRKDIQINLHIKVQGDCRQYFRGDVLCIGASIIRQRPINNFAPDPFANFFLVRRIHAQATTKSAHLLSLVTRTGCFWHSIGLWRNRIRAEIEHYFFSSAKANARAIFLLATILGDRGQLDDVQKEQLIQAGIFHLIAISGANFGMLALIALILLRKFGLSMRQRYIVTSVILVVYLFISGFSVSALRAVLMALMIFLVRFFSLKIRIANVVSISGLILLWANPTEFLNPGFILTYALTMSLVMGRKIFLPLMSALPDWLKEFLAANISASIISLPLSLYYFQRYSLAGFFAGLVLIPLTTIITAGGVLLLLAAILGHAICLPLLITEDLLLRIFFFVANFCSKLRWSIVRPEPALIVILVILGLFYWLSVKKSRCKIIAGIALLGLLVAISLDMPARRNPRLEVYYLDIGHGDAQVIIFPSGQALLVDGGGALFSDFSVGRTYLLPFLLRKRIKVSCVAVTHFHPDHVRGIIEIIDFIKPKELWLASVAQNDFWFKALRQAVPAATKVRQIERGFRQINAGCLVECLYPEHFINTATTHNNHSMVLRVSDAYHGFLFTGDIEKEAEGELLLDQSRSLACTVLKVAHHGSKSSSSTAFLQAAQPDIAIISCVSSNQLKLPAPEVLQRLKHEKIRWLLTFRSGGIHITSFPEKLQVEVSR